MLVFQIPFMYKFNKFKLLEGALFMNLKKSKIGQKNLQLQNKKSIHDSSKLNCEISRRIFLKNASLAVGLGLIAQVLPRGAYAAQCNFTDHLLGEIPSNSNPAISTTGQFHHFHYLHVPQVILDSPPQAGWSTLSSMMVPELGIDGFFFGEGKSGSAKEREIQKQFHCHQVYFSNAQLRQIASGQRTDVIAYIRGRDGKPSRNHTFTFNKPGSSVMTVFEQDKIQIQQIAKQRNLRTVRETCDTQIHQGVIVFNGQGQRIVTNVNELNSLKGY